MDGIRELEHFHIGESCGGDQGWFSDYWMKIGGCAAVTACDLCIYLARNRGMANLCPFDANSVTKEDYLSFGEIMRPYLSPRPMGIHTTEIYIEGFERYLADRGGAPLALSGFSGREDTESAVALVRDQIDRGFPVPYLMLLHRDKKLDDYMWHWFLLNAYEETPRSFRVRAVSYGKEIWVDLRHLWRTGRRRKGGFVVLRETRTPPPIKETL